jgi:hypothetical protein
VLITGDAYLSVDIGTDVAGHLGPPVVVGYELEGLEAACVRATLLT